MKLSDRVRIPRRFAIAAKEVICRAIPAVLEAAGITDGRYRLSPVIRQYSPDPERPVDRSRLVHGGSLLQLAERAGRFAEGSVVLPSQRVRSYTPGDDDSR